MPLVTLPAERYLQGEWENADGWVQLKQPAWSGLVLFDPPPLRTRERKLLHRLRVVRGVTAGAKVHLRRLLVEHARRFPDFQAISYYQFLLRNEEHLDLTLYLLENEVLGASVNFVYPDEGVVVSQLFPWLREKHPSLGLGALDYQLQGIWFRALGYGLMALCEHAIYKQKIFGDSYETRSR